jgi:uncharacterized protein (DUF1786 family)
MPGTLILDIGSGTQDVLYHLDDRELLNCPKFVLPTPARRVAARLQELAGQAVWFHGTNMGGGFFRVLKQHLAEGGRAAITERAAHTLTDTPPRVETMGMTLSETCPEGYVPLQLTDYDPEWWGRLLDAADLPRPDCVVAAAQDHGNHAGQSNRRGRFRLWERLLLDSGGDPAALIYDTPPPELTRLAALQRSIGGGPVADTGAAAVLGALFVEEIVKTTGITRTDGHDKRDYPGRGGK